MIHPYVSLSCLALLAAIVVNAQSPPTPDIVHVPLTASSDNQRYFAQVNMSYGAQTQRFGFALSTTTGYTVVADTACTSCGSNNIPTYNATQSTSAKAIDSGQQQQSVAIAGGAVNGGAGVLSKEDCALHQANGSFWLYTNQTIVQANNSQVFQAGISGLIGLGTNTANFDDTIFGSWLRANPAQHNVTFGLALNPLGTQNQGPASTSSGGDPNDASSSAGTLHMLQPDPLSYTGDIQWQQVQNMAPATGANDNSTGVTAGDLGGGSWLIRMDAWNFTSGSAQTSNTKGALAAVEPFFTNIFLPKDQATQLYASLNGAQPLPGAPGDLGQAYSIPCDADITFSATFSGQEYLVPKEALVVQSTNGACTGAIEGWVDAAATNYLLGSRFISTVYLVFQVSRPPSTQQQVGIAQRVKGSQPKHKPAVGAIVGGTVGGVAFILLLGGAMFWWIKRRQRRSRMPAKSDATIDGMESMHEKAGSGIPNVDKSYAVDHWAPSSLSHTPTPSGGTFSQTHTAGATPDPHYAPVGTPSSANFSHLSPPVSAAAHEPIFLGTHSPPGTATSESFPISPLPKVNQWVTGMRATGDGGPVRNVPTEYDYGNHGEPGQILSPSFPEAVEGAFGAGSHDSHASSTLAAQSESWKPNPPRQLS